MVNKSDLRFEREVMMEGEFLPGVYCSECGEKMTADEYSCGTCFHCGGDVASEEDLTEDLSDE